MEIFLKWSEHLQPLRRSDVKAFIEELSVTRVFLYEVERTRMSASPQEFGVSVLSERNARNPFVKSSVFSALLTPQYTPQYVNTTDSCSIEYSERYYSMMASVAENMEASCRLWHGHFHTMDTSNEPPVPSESDLWTWKAWFLPRGIYCFVMNYNYGITIWAGDVTLEGKPIFYNARWTDNFYTCMKYHFAHCVQQAFGGSVVDDVEITL